MSLSVGLFGLFGALVSIPLLRWGRRFDAKILVAVERWGAWLFPPVFVGSLMLLYPWPHVIVLTVAVAATWVFFVYWSPAMSWRSRFRRVAAVGLLCILICELWLSAALAGGFPHKNPTLCAWVGGSRSLPALITALKDDNWDMRLAAAEALVKIGDKSAVPALIAALNYYDTQARLAAAEALGNIGDKSAVPALIVALKDDDTQVRQAAAKALGKIGDKSAVPALQEGNRTGRSM